MNFKGYKRDDGTVGIRNKILIISVDECCEGIADNIKQAAPDTVLLTNYYTCMLGGNEESFNQMVAVGCNPNIAAVLVIAMGCGSILPEYVADPIRKTGRPVEVLTCEKEGGTRKTIEAGRTVLTKFRSFICGLKSEEFPLSALTVGVKCGGSDTSSGIASNPAVGRAVDMLVDMGGTCIGGELFELLGCDSVIDKRAVSEEVAAKIKSLINYEKERWSVPGVDIETMSIGNAVGGITTIEEKSLGALYKTGTRPIRGILQINAEGIDKAGEPGFYLSEVTMLCGGSGVNFAALGAHIILWTTGGAGFQNEVVPVITVSGNKDLINDDIDVNVTGLMDGSQDLETAAKCILEKIVYVAGGAKTAVEGYGKASMTLYQKDRRLEKLLNIECRQ